MDMILAGGDPGTLEQLAALCGESGGMGRVICASAGQALAYGEGCPVDLLFLDMETLGRDGFELLRRLRSIHGEVQAAVIAADGRYALEAYQNDICDYILAPPDREAILRAVEKARRLIRGGRTQRVVLCTFGRFDLFVDGHAVDFKSRKAKELMAFLTAQKGGIVGMELIVAELWEDEPFGENVKVRFRKALMNLRRALEEHGLRWMLQSRRGRLSLDCTGVECDYFRLLEGDERAAQEFHGEFMSAYSWGEAYLPELERMAEQVLRKHMRDEELEASGQ